MTSLIWTLIPVLETSVQTAGYCLFCKTHMQLSHNAPLSGHAALSLSVQLKALSGSSLRGSKARRPHATSPSWLTPLSPVLPTPGPPHQTPTDQSLTSDLHPLGSASFTGLSSQPLSGRHRSAPRREESGGQTQREAKCFFLCHADRCGVTPEEFPQKHDPRG